MKLRLETASASQLADEVELGRQMSCSTRPTTPRSARCEVEGTRPTKRGRQAAREAPVELARLVPCESGLGRDACARKSNLVVSRASVGSSGSRKETLFAERAVQSARIVHQELRARAKRAVTRVEAGRRCARRPVAVLTQRRFEIGSGEQTQVDWGQISVWMGRGATADSSRCASARSRIVSTSVTMPGSSSSSWDTCSLPPGPVPPGPRLRVP